MGGKVTYSEKTAVRILKMKADLEVGKMGLRDCESFLFAACLPLAAFSSPPEEARRAFALAWRVYRDLVRKRKAALARLLAVYVEIMKWDSIPSMDEITALMQVVIWRIPQDLEPLKEELEAWEWLLQIMKAADKGPRALSLQMQKTLKIGKKKNGGKHAKH